jgi:EAL domain-containing protein (putative c-di-GMP-specific phosphodiesterase class I)/PAS domain-containing protein
MIRNGNVSDGTFRGDLFHARIRPLAIAALVVIPFIVLIWVFVYQFKADDRQQQRDEFFDNQQRYAQVQEVAIESLYQSLYSDLLVVYNSDNFQNFLKDEHASGQFFNLVERLQASKPYISYIRVETEAPEPAVRKELIVSGIEKHEDFTLLTMSRPIYVGDSYEGLLTIGFRGDYITDSLTEQSIPLNPAITTAFIDHDLLPVILAGDDHGLFPLDNSLAQQIMADKNGMIEHEGLIIYFHRIKPFLQIDAAVPSMWSISYGSIEELFVGSSHEILSHPELQWSLAVAFYVVMILLVLMRQVLVNKRELEQISHLIADYSHDGVIVTDSRRQIIYCNQTMELISGYKRSDLIGEKPSIFTVDEPNGAPSFDQSEKINEDGGTFYKTVWDSTIWDKGNHNQYFLSHLSVRKLLNTRGKTRFYVGIYSNPTKSAFEIDDVTQTAESIEHKQRDFIPQTLIDRFCVAGESLRVIVLKVVNYDKLETRINQDDGYLFSNRMVSRIRSIFQKRSRIAVYDPGSYLIMSPDTNQEDMDRKIDLLFEELKKPIEISGVSHDVQVVGGMSCYPDHGSSGAELLFKARVALGTLIYESNKHPVLTFDQRMYDRIQREMKIIQKFPAALADKDIILWYQPQISVSDGRMMGAEALARWFDTELGYVSPGEWLPLAEKTGYGTYIFDHILEEVIAFTARLNRERDKPLQISVNLSAADLIDDKLIEQISGYLERYQADPSWLKIELTESSIMEDMEKADQRLRELQHLGLTTAIDDFGTGFSSFSYLEHLALDILKIDRSFIMGYPEHSDGTIVRAIVSMAKTLGMSVIAEGVETQQQLELLKSVGCDQMQGFLYSPAVSGDKLIQMSSTDPDTSV